MRYVLLALLFSGCSVLKPASHGPGPEFTYKTSGTVSGVAVTDNDCVFDVSFKDSTRFKITAGNALLNRYEFSVGREKVCFGHFVDDSGGVLTYPVPFVPAVPAGTPFQIEFDN